jgi:hypothetical protein
MIGRALLAAVRNGALAVVDGRLGRPGVRFASEPGTGVRRLAAGRMGFDVLSVLVAEALANGLKLYAAGGASVTALALQRTSVAGSASELRIDLINVSNQVLGRISGYRIADDQWNLRFYPSVGGFLTGTPMLELGAATISLDGTLTLLHNFPIVPAPVSGTPAQHALYTDNVPKAWASVAANGTLQAGFNITSVTTAVPGFSSLYQITFTRAFANANYAVVVTSALPDGICSVTFKTTTTCQVAVLNTAGGANPGIFGFVAFGAQ